MTSQVLTGRRAFVLTTLTALLLVVAGLVPMTARATSGTLSVLTDTVLAEDHAGNIVIEADGVTVDCAGHSVRGDGTGVGILLDGRAGVTVTRCDVRQFFQGILLRGSSANTLLLNSVSDNVLTGIKFEDSHRNVVRFNDVSDNRSEIGLGATALHLEGSSYNELALNTVTGNESTGIAAAASHWNRITGNVSSRNGGKGFHLIDAAHNIVSENTAMHNADSGFDLAWSAFNAVTNNRACFNTPWDAVATEDGLGNIWQVNQFCASSI